MFDCVSWLVVVPWNGFSWNASSGDACTFSSKSLLMRRRNSSDEPRRGCPEVELWSATYTGLYWLWNQLIHLPLIGFHLNTSGDLVIQELREDFLDGCISVSFETRGSLCTVATSCGYSSSRDRSCGGLSGLLMRTLSSRASGLLGVSGIFEREENG